MNPTLQQERLCLLLVEAEVALVLRAPARTARCSNNNSNHSRDQHHRPLPPLLRHWQENDHPANELDQARKWQNEALFEFLERNCHLCSSMEVMGTAIHEKIALAI